MKIKCTFITTNTQIHTGKCYLLGISSENKTFQAYDIETSGSAANANTAGYRHENGQDLRIAKPGVLCSNGLYVTGDGNAAIFWSEG